MLDLIQLCVTSILELHPTFSVIFASSQRWGCYFNIGTFCGIVEQWCGLQWPLTGFIEIFEQNTVDVLLYFECISKYELYMLYVNIFGGFPM